MRDRVTTVPDDDRDLRDLIARVEQRILDRLDRPEASMHARIDRLLEKLTPAPGYPHDGMSVWGHARRTGGEER